MRQAVDELIEDGFILINGRKVALQFHLSGDYKASKMKMDYQNCRVHLTMELVSKTI